MEGREIPPNQEPDSSQERLKINCNASTIASDVHSERNEDDYFFDPDKGTFGIFDGMGGEQNGQWCAQTSCQIIKEFLKDQNHLYPRDAKEILKNARNLANSAVYREDKIQGSTAIFGFLCETNDDGNQIVLVNVGDSRAYLFRDGELTQLTTDDNIIKVFSENERKKVQSLLDNVSSRNELTEEEFGIFGNREKITDCIGTKTVAGSKIITQPVTQNDLIIFATDGVHDNLTATEIYQIISQNFRNPELISQKLTNAALVRSREKVFRSKPDDMTTLVVAFKKEKNSPPKPEIEELPINFTPKTGQVINIQRSSGVVEGGWKISSYQDKILVVEKGDLEKIVKFSDADRYNRLITIDDIATSRNVLELKYTLKKLGGLTGSRYYPVDDLLSLVDNAYRNEGSVESLQFLTGAGKLRQTVQRLIESEKQNKQ